MIDKKKITEAANSFYPEGGVLETEKRISFTAGVQWFKHAIWHDKSEEPTQEGIIIVQGVLNGENLASVINWVEVLRESIEIRKETGITQEEIDECIRLAWKEFGNFDKWCYLADLLPHPQISGNQRKLEVNFP